MTVTLACRIGAIHVEARAVHGCLAVTPWIDFDGHPRRGKYAITHMPSGQALGHEQFTLRQAKELAKQLHAQNDALKWDTAMPSMSKTRRKRLARQFEQTKAEVLARLREG